MKIRTIRTAVSGLFLLLAALAALPVSADDAAGEIVSVIFYQRDGTQVSYALDESPTLTFRANGRYLILRTATETVLYQVQKLEKFVFSDDPTGIRTAGAESVRTGQGKIAPRTGQIYLSGFKPQTPVRVTDCSGHLLLSITTADDGTALLSLSSLGKGVYIVSAGSVWLKVAK